MRQIKSLLIVLLIAGPSMAQQNEAESEFSSSYALKWNPLSLAVGKVGLFGEYNFKHKKSVTLAVGIPYTNNFSYELDNEDRNFAMKTFSIMGGYRMYMGKKDMRGFYFEPYLKYLKNDASTTISADLDGKPTNFLTTSNYSAIGVGAQLGLQFMIAKRVAFDLFLLGPEANSAHHKVVMKDVTSTAPWSAEDAADAQREIDENIGDLPILGSKLKVTVDAASKTVSSDYKGFLPGFRSGLSIGFKF